MLGLNLTDVSTCVSSEYPQRVEAGEAKESEDRDSGVKTGNWETWHILLSQVSGPNCGHGIWNKLTTIKLSASRLFLRYRIAILISVNRGHQNYGNVQFQRCPHLAQLFSLLHWLLQGQVEF